MADTPAFQGHHVVEQGAFKQSRLLQSLSKSGLFDLHGPSNMLNLPADQALAAKMGLSPHSGVRSEPTQTNLELRLGTWRCRRMAVRPCEATKQQRNA